MRRLLAAVLVLSAAGGRVEAQSSLFGTRGLGIPQAPTSARVAGMAGSAVLFDGLSGLNPAALTAVQGLTVGINFYQNWRSSTTPGGTGSASDPGMPYVTVVSRIKDSKFYASGGFGIFTDRNFGYVTVDTTPVGGTAVEVTDSLRSTGGTSDIRVALGYRPGRTLSVGLGFQFLTGSNRLTLRRSFSDTLFAQVQQRSELEFDAIGLSAGAVYHPGESFLLAGSVSHNGTLTVNRDSLPAWDMPMPWAFRGAAQLRVGRKATVDASVNYATWGVANDDLLALGGTGAFNSLQAALGMELVTNVVSPGKLPLRLGVRTGNLPFPLVPGEQPSETAVSAGTGVRFAKSRAAADFALQRVWRDGGTGFSETAWTLYVGLVLKP